MLPRALQFLPEKTFARKLFMLASGTIAGQALVVLSSPLVTRLFTPAEFGIFAVFSALVAIAGVIACLRLEFAVAVIEDDADAGTMVALGAVVASGMAGLCSILILLFGERLARATDAPELALWLWLLPATVMIFGFGSLLSYWSLRRGTYRVNGLNRTLQLGSQAGGQVALGLFGTGSPGLMLGWALGYGVRLVHYFGNVATGDRALFKWREAAQAWRVLRENWRYPAFSSPTSFIESICEMVPAILIAALYGPAMAGWYALGQRLMSLPMKLLGEAACQVFLGEGRNLRGRELQQFFRRTLFLFSGLGLVIMLPVLLFAPPLFALIFGEAWREAGVIVQLLVPLHLARFITIPVSQLFVVLNRQNVYLATSTIAIVALLISFGLFGYVLDLEAMMTIFIFSSLSSLSFFVALAMLWQLMHREVAGREAAMQP